MIWTVLAIVYLVIAGIGATKMKEVAEKKGYDDSPAWSMCFWLGIFGYMYVIALPDRVAYEQNRQILKELKEIKDSLERNTVSA